MERLQRGPNPLLPNVPLITGATTETQHVKPCPTHKTFSLPTCWRHVVICSLHLQKTLTKWDSSTTIALSSSEPLLIATTSLASQTFPSHPVWPCTSPSVIFCVVLREMNQHQCWTEAQLPSWGNTVMGNKYSTNRKHGTVLQKQSSLIMRICAQAVWIYVCISIYCHTQICTYTYMYYRRCKKALHLLIPSEYTR